VAETGQPVLLRSRPRGKIDFNARNLLCVPLVAREQVIGVLEVLNKKEGTFSQQDLELLTAIAAFAAIAIENARLHESVLDERDRVIDAEERARVELARDLHDGPIQLAASVVMRLNFCQMLLAKEPVDQAHLAKEIAQTVTLAEQSIQQMRTMLFELRPLVLETEGLESALTVFLERRQQELLQEQKTTLSLNIESDEPGGQISSLDNKVEAAIFAIAQEAVNNALKHAEASKITVELRETPVGLYLTIVDDGRGFDVEQVMDNYAHQASLGMMNIQERSAIIGGDLSIKSAPGQGTRIRVYIPKEKDERLKKRKTGMLSTASLSRTGSLPEM
jgi:signal transduction histidine kinase